MNIMLQSNFVQRKVDEEKDKDKKVKNDDSKHGSGRSIPVKQASNRCWLFCCLIDQINCLARNSSTVLDLVSIHRMYSLICSELKMFNALKMANLLLICMFNNDTISLIQGFLYKKSGKPLSKEWKKKYITLLDDGRLLYFPSLNVR